jgi:hypothetical protein
MALISGRVAMRGIMRAVTCGLAGGILMLAVGVTGAVAQDEDLTFDQKIMRSVLGTFGIRSGSDEIEYRERSPLVVPPSANLPAPQTEPASKAANWPNDPTVKRRKQEAEKRRSGGSVYNEHEDARALRPDELEMGRVLQRSGMARAPTDAEKDGRPMKPSELGYTGGVFGSLFGQTKESTPVFTGEPPRTSLTEPPVGYQTPSPNQPYRSGGKDKWLPFIPDMFSARE